jgi:hypothetical protein
MNTIEESGCATGDQSDLWTTPSMVTSFLCG